MPETMPDTRDPAVNYGLSPYPDEIYNLMRTKDTKQPIISMVTIIKGVIIHYIMEMYIR